ncbi:ABC transporter permease [Thiosocius teredinicola]|uniref:ABC transporter permease n=1 Tax=Thiosocius teredinicola TaxID=1973002 RepID=UPI0009910528
MIASIALHEWRRLRSGMMFWLTLAFAQLIIAWLAFTQLEAFARIAPQLKARNSPLGAMDLVIAPSMNTLVMLLLLVTPILGMGSIAGETQSGRISLWLSAPVRSSRVVVGKWLGLWLATLPIVISVLSTLAAFGLATELDWPRFMLAAFGLVLLSMWLAAINVWLSGLFDHPAAALALSYGLLLFLWLLDSFSGPTAPWYWLALLPHIKPMFAGLLQSQDLVYFAVTAIAVLLLATFGIARRRGEV